MMCRRLFPLLRKVNTNMSWNPNQGQAPNQQNQYGGYTPPQQNAPYGEQQYGQQGGYQQGYTPPQPGSPYSGQQYGQQGYQQGAYGQQQAYGNGTGSVSPLG